MELQKQSCRNCGGDLVGIDSEHYKCKYCGSVYTRQVAEKHIDTLKKLFDDIKLEAVSNARKNLFDAVNAEYISNAHVHECCFEIKKHLPDDFQANFYETAIGSNNRKIAKMIRKIDVSEYFDCVESMIRFLIISLQSEFILETGDLIERAYKSSDLVKFEKYSTALSVEAEKLEDCIYMTAFPRDVFVAYSSKDMDKVFELVECLEDQGFSCFVAARNLRHGRGAVENYDKALKEAMDSCRSFVFVSSASSRHPGCDALKKEIPYIKNVDIANAPAELRQDYASIPQKYKKHRVEYRIEESARQSAADRMVSEFFDGYERVYSPEEVADRILNAPTEIGTVTAVATVSAPVQSVKYCTACMGECPANAKFCMNCGGGSFADTLKEAELAKKLAALEQQGGADVKKTDIIPKAPESKGLTFAQGKGGVTLTGIGSCRDSYVVIPESYQDKSVTEIGEGALMNCPDVESIFIPKTVKVIGRDVFTESNSLENIYVDASNPSYKSEGGVLYSKDGTALIKYPPSKGDASFTVPDGVRVIEECAFMDSIALKEAILPNSVTAVNTAAFMRCSRLERVNIPFKVTSIETMLFCDCPNIRTIDLPDRIKYIDSNAFSGCSALSEINIPQSVTAIGDSAFAGCSSLEEIKLPDTVQNIYDGAFRECTSLTSLELPMLLNKISEGLFVGCNALESVTVPVGIRAIEDNAFMDCTSLSSLELPFAVTSIGECAFMGCESLEELTLTDNINYIGQDAFIGCTSLSIRPVELGDNPNSNINDILYCLQNGEPYGEPPLSDDEDYGGIITSGGGAPVPPMRADEEPDFDDLGYNELLDGDISDDEPYKSEFILENLVDDDDPMEDDPMEMPPMDTKKASIPTKSGNGKRSPWSEGLEYEWDGTGYIVIGIGSCRDSDIVIPSTYKNESVLAIGDRAFVDCKQITSVVIPSGVSVIGRSSFTGCSNMKSITLSDTVAVIDPCAFYDCESLRSIHLPKNVEKLGYMLFYNCKNFDSITVDSANKNFASIDGNLYSKDARTLIQYAFGKKATEFTVPDGVTRIGDSAFSHSHALKKITLPKSLTFIGNSAFYDCSKLEYVNIPANVTEIQRAAFEACDSLARVGFVVPIGWKEEGKLLFGGISQKTLSSVGAAAKYLKGAIKHGLIRS